MRHLKYKPKSIVLLRQLDSDGKVATIWGGQVLAAAPEALTVLAIEMVYQKEEWHCVGEFRQITAPPHRVPYQWDFPGCSSNSKPTTWTWRRARSSRPR